MKISHLDHLVLTVASIEVSAAFYSRVLGMDVVTFGEGRTALTFGTQKLNLHQLGNEFEPKAQQPTAGAVDLCLLTETPIAEVIHELQQAGIEIIAGPVRRTGATGPILSVYFRDPDHNLLEVANSL